MCERTAEVSQALIWGLQVNGGKEVNLQIWKPLSMRIDCTLEPALRNLVLDLAFSETACESDT